MLSLLASLRMRLANALVPTDADTTVKVEGLNYLLNVHGRTQAAFDAELARTAARINAEKKAAADRAADAVIEVANKVAARLRASQGVL